MILNMMVFINTKVFTIFTTIGVTSLKISLGVVIHISWCGPHTALSCDGRLYGNHVLISGGFNYAIALVKAMSKNV